MDNLLIEQQALMKAKVAILAAPNSAFLADVCFSLVHKFDENIPAIVFISLESEAHNNLMNLYKRTYIQEHGVEAPGEIDDEGMSTYISEVFSKRGWKFILIRRIGEYFTFEELEKMVNDYYDYVYKSEENK